ncbi:MAG: hypothetical protein HY021_03355 [Burkholderiales bacterium]|nr:hypothetical protein [Burkholderiales bacterium]
MSQHRQPENNPDPQRRALVAAAAAAVVGGAGLVGCGGGGDESAAPARPEDARQRPLSGVDGGGTGGRVRSYISAAIQSVGPLVAGNVQFDTAQASIVDGDGAPLPSTSLAAGQHSRIEASAIRGSGTQAQAVALTINLGEDLLGPVASIDSVARTLTVLGQRVLVQASTIVDPTLGSGLADLRAGALLQIWGQLDVARARIVATRIAAAPSAPAAFIVRGVLSGVDRATGSVSIGALTALLDSGVSVPPELGTGLIVRARLRPSTASAVVLALRGDAPLPPDHVEAEIEGRVTQFSSPRSFAVDGVPVDASGVSYPAGALLPSLGAHVEVHGRSEGGALRASEVQVEADTGGGELDGAISAVDAATRTFTVRGVTVAWDSDTRFVGGSALKLAPRRKVEIKGRYNGDRTRLTASSVHLED